MKELRESMKRTCREKRTELALMAAFLLLFAVVAGPDIAKEASSGNVSKESAKGETEDSILAIGEDAEALSETGADDDGDARPRSGRETLESGEDRQEENGNANDPGDVTGGDPQDESAGDNQEDESGSSSRKDSAQKDAEDKDRSSLGKDSAESGSKKESARSSLEDADQSSLGKNRGRSDSEKSSAGVASEKTDAETEMTAEELWESAALQLQIRYGESFCIPMDVPAEESGIRRASLKDTQSLHGFTGLTDQLSGRSLEVLRRILARTISEYDGDWSVYIKNLKTDEAIVIHDRPMKSASVMKLFIMGTVYKAFESGELERTEEMLSLVNSMITVSDNTASNELLYRLGEGSYADGIARVDEFIQEYGFSEMTVEYNGFNDPATNTGTGNYNQVSARDCGKLLEDIYRRSWVSRSVSNEMETMLLNQQTRYKIPAGLPDGVLCGNKTGEMDTTENDAAIVYSESCDYILVVLSSDWSSKNQAIDRIKQLSARVYWYLNGES